MKHIHILAGAFLALAATPALADNGYTTDAVHMLAGPNQTFPQVMRLSAGRPVTIHGCLSTYTWCDVEWRGNRGWVPGGALTLSQQSSMRVGDIGDSVNVPHTTFDVRSYWEQNYQARPWYADRNTWYRAVGSDSADESFHGQEARSE